MKRPNNKSGFTLIEIMVSISIFAVVMLIVIGALLMLNDANKKAQALRAVVDNINFAMDDVTRNIRTGQDFRCSLFVDSANKQLGGPGDAVCNLTQAKQGIETIAFTGLGQEGGQIRRTCYVYSYVPGTDTTPGSIVYGTYAIPVENEQNCDLYLNSSFVPLSTFVSPEVDVRGLKFYVIDDNIDKVNNPNQQPIVIIALSGDINVEKYKFKTPFNIQTTVSKRGAAL